VSGGGEGVVHKPIAIGAIAKALEEKYRLELGAKKNATLSSPMLHR